MHPTLLRTTPVCRPGRPAAAAASGADGFPAPVPGRAGRGLRRPRGSAPRSLPPPGPFSGARPGPFRRLSRMARDRDGARAFELRPPGDALDVAPSPDRAGPLASRLRGDRRRLRGEQPARQGGRGPPARLPRADPQAPLLAAARLDRSRAGPRWNRRGVLLRVCDGRGPSPVGRARAAGDSGGLHGGRLRRRRVRRLPPRADGALPRPLLGKAARALPTAGPRLRRRVHRRLRHAAQPGSLPARLPRARSGCGSSSTSRWRR